jgi:hypothetical protein
MFSWGKTSNEIQRLALGCNLESFGQDDVAPGLQVLDRSLNLDVRPDPDPFKSRPVRKSVPDGGDVQQHAVIESGEIRELERAGCVFADKFGALRHLEGHHEILAGA